MKKVGLWASVICAIHCTVLPLLMVVIPTTGVYLFINETFEFVLLGISTVTRALYGKSSYVLKEKSCLNHCLNTQFLFLILFRSHP